MRVRFRPLSPWLIVFICGTLLLPVALAEPPLGFLPDQPVATKLDGSLCLTTYSRPGSLFEELPAIDQEMTHRGYRRHLRLGDRSVVYDRPDGHVVRLIGGYWRDSAGLQPYLTVMVEDPSLVARASTWLNARFRRP